MNCTDCRQSLTNHRSRQPLDQALQDHLESCSDCLALWKDQQQLEPWLEAWKTPVLSRDFTQNVQSQLRPHSSPVLLDQAKTVRWPLRTAEWLAPGATLVALGLMITVVFQPFLPTFSRQPSMPSIAQTGNTAWGDLVASVQADYATLSARSSASSTRNPEPDTFLPSDSDEKNTVNSPPLFWLPLSPTKQAEIPRSLVAGKIINSKVAPPLPDDKNPITPPDHNSSTHMIKSSFQSAFGFLENSLPEPIDTAG